MNLGKQAVLALALLLLVSPALVLVAGPASASLPEPPGGSGAVCKTQGRQPCPKGCWTSGVHGEVHGTSIWFYKYTGRDGAWIHYDVGITVYPSPAQYVGKISKYCP